jgi:spore coat protein U-like protein
MRVASSHVSRASVIGAVLCAALITASAARAQPAPTTGVLQVTAQIESGCRVVGQSAVTGVDFGELDFGTHPSLFNQTLTAQSQLGMGTLQLRCVGVTSANVTVDAGTHAVGNQRRLGSGTSYVPYELFLDSAGAVPLSVNTARSVPISVSGELTVVDLPVYGRVPPTVGGYAPGAYADLVQITVSW